MGSAPQVQPRAWSREGSVLWCDLEVHPDQLGLAEDYALHRLRRLRARRHGFLHPSDVRVEATRLTIRFDGRATLEGGSGAPLPFARWRRRIVLPALTTLVECHGQGVVGFPFAPVDGRWVVPSSWFLPSADANDGALRHADLLLARRWIEEELNRRPDGRQERQHPLLRPLLAALGRANPGEIEQLVGADQAEAERAARVAPDAPTFLSLLTEAELLERVAGVYAYRHLPEDEAERLGLRAPDHRVLEVDARWRDPHFAISRPSPQELWDSLIEDSRTTPILALSATLPNPLDGRLGDSVVVRWIGVHEDQPFMFVRTDRERPPSRGYLRIHQAGENTLMARKRTFTSFAGGHPAISDLLTVPPRSSPFTNNTHARTELEDAVLQTRGVFAVQGPPGTGKTHLATEVVRRYLGRIPSARVLVCAKEHFALDHILRKITLALERDGIPVRAWRSVSLAKLRRSRGEVDGTWLPAVVARDLAGRDWAADSAGWSTYQASTADLHDQRLATLGQAAANVFFCTTMDGAMVQFLDQESFDLVIVEEAGKVYPSELLHALCLGRTVLMIGDQRQLPPFQERQTREGIAAWVKAIERARTERETRGGLVDRFGEVFLALEAMVEERGSLTPDEQAWLRPFEFLFDRLPTRHRLEEQFRMEAPLSRVVGSVFYGRPFVHRKNELIERGLLSPRPLGDAIPPELDVPLLWIDTPHMTDAPEATEDNQKRGVRDNRYEHDVVVSYLRTLRPTSAIDLVILTPYNAQKRLLLDSAELRDICGRLTTEPFEQVIRTTDEYQGREAELTVLSLVRNNSLGARAWGFMTEPERLNVMFSRTRFRQVVVGCSAHIVRHAKEAEWLHRIWEAYLNEAADPRAAKVLKPEALRRG